MRKFYRALSVVVFTLGLATSAFGQSVGDRIVIAKDSELRLTTQVVDRVSTGTVLTVNNVNGNWLWVEHNKAGWIDKGNVISVSAHVAALKKNGDSAFSQKRFDEARRIFDKILTLEPENAHALLYHADTYFAQSKYEAAIEGYERALKVDRNDYRTYYWRGDALTSLNRFEEAINNYDRSLELSPKSQTVYQERGSTKVKAGNYASAIVDFTVALHFSKTDSVKSRIHNLRGEAWLKNGDQEAAIADFVTSARLQPGNSLLWLKAAKILATSSQLNVRDGKKAVKYATMACNATNDPSADSLAVLAAAHAEAKQFAYAAQIQRKALAKAGNDVKDELSRQLDIYLANGSVAVNQVGK